MALSQKLELRQGQSLVMTPQLQQAIGCCSCPISSLCAYRRRRDSSATRCWSATEADDEGPEAADGDRDPPSSTAPATNGERARVASDPARIRRRRDRRRSSTPTRQCLSTTTMDTPRASRAGAAGRAGRSPRARLPVSPRTSISRPSSPARSRLRDHLAEQLAIDRRRPASTA